MSRFFVVAAFVVALVVGIPVMTMLRDIAGPNVVAFVALATAALACVLTDDFRAALKDAGIAQKEAAILIGISEATLSNQLAEKEPATRLWAGLSALGPAFRRAFYKRQLAREECAVLERGELCDLVNAVHVLTAERRRPRFAPARREVA